MSRRWAFGSIALAAALVAALVGWRAKSARPAATRAEAPAATPTGTSAARAGDRAAKDSRMQAAPRSTGAVIARASWGAGDGQVGHKLDPESAPEGPMSLTVDHDGNLLVLDQINRRILRFTRDGKRLAPVPIGGDTAQDLLATPSGSLALLDRLGEQNLQLHAADGKLLGEVSLRGPKIPEPGGVTGLFSDAGGDLYVEREHGELVRVADADGNSDPARPTVPGRPRRDGKLYLRGAIEDRAAGTFHLRALDAAGAPAWETTVAFGAPLLYIALLDSDRAGEVFVAARVARESPNPPYSLIDERIELRSLGADGSPRGALSLDPAPAPEEIFREFTVADDGTVYRMRRTSSGVVLEQYRL